MGGTETNEADKAVRVDKLFRLLTARLQGESSKLLLVWEDFISDGRRGG